MKLSLLHLHLTAAAVGVVSSFSLSSFVASPASHQQQQIQTSMFAATVNAPSLPTSADEQQQQHLQQQQEEDIDPTQLFPPPLTSAQRVARALSFYRRILPVLASYKAKEIEIQLKRQFDKDAVSAEEEAQIWSDLDEWGSEVVASTIKELRGFYVKSGQVISTRVDLFPEAYTSKLAVLQDGLEPMPFEQVEAVVRHELLDGAPLSELFATFEREPLGSASIAQVHKATLLDGRTVAVKLQRPNVEPKLLGDVANLKRISKLLKDSLPVDYYTVFCELGDALVNELDFLAEAQAMRKIDLAVRHTEGGVIDNDASAPISIPLPVGELVSKRVLVMDFVEGVPLNRLSEKMAEKGIKAGSPESKLAGRRILDSLVSAFGRMIFGSGFVHGDPHPGNIFIGEGGKVSLIDCGQFKALSRPQRVQLAQVVLAVADYQKSSEDSTASADAKRRLAELVREFGVTFLEGYEADDDLACAVALVLFGDSDRSLPGGYSSNELSEVSPLKRVASFPQELVLMGRATVLIKGIAKKLEVPLSLAGRWRDGCTMTVEAASQPVLPLWGKNIVTNDSTSTTAINGETKIRFRQVARLFKDYAKGKGQRLAGRAVNKAPQKLKRQLMNYLVKRQERLDTLQK
jgi:aarF domain-containing kinase